MIEAFPEKLSTRLLLLFMVGAVLLLIHQPWLYPWRELFAAEGYYVVQSLEINWRLPICTAHGAIVGGAYPLYPLMVSLISGVTTLPVELAARLLSFAAMCGSTCLIFGAASGGVRFRAGLVGALLYAGSVIVLEQVMYGDPFFLFSFLLLSAQVAFFRIGVRGGNWSRAWMTSLVLLSLAFYAGGWAALWYYILPLVFMRRPLKVWPKLNKPGFWIGLAVLAGTVALWILPVLALSRNMTLQRWPIDFGTPRDYLEQLLEFPFRSALRLLPLTFVIWTPFCPALSKLDETPLWSRYLRTLALVILFMVYLTPGRDAKELVLAVGPLAILCGGYYERATRMYGTFFRHLTLFAGWYMILLIGLLTGFVMTSDRLLGKLFSVSGGVGFRTAPGYMPLLLLAILLLALLAVWCFRAAAHGGPIFSALLAIGCGSAIFYWMVLFPYRAQVRTLREMGALVHEAMGTTSPSSHAVIYKHGIMDFHGEGYYAKYPFLRINSLSELPENGRVVYLLSTEFPKYPSRNWVNLLPQEFTYKQQRLCLWRGELIRREPEGLFPSQAGGEKK